MHRFAGIELISDRILDEATILTFHQLLEKHDLGEHIYYCAEDFVFETVKDLPSIRGMTIRQGTIVDATLIADLSSTSMRAQPEWAGGQRTKMGSANQKWTSTRRATSGSGGGAKDQLLHRP